MDGGGGESGGTLLLFRDQSQEHRQHWVGIEEPKTEQVGSQGQSRLEGQFGNAESRIRSQGQVLGFRQASHRSGAE